MIAQIDKTYIKTRPGKLYSRILSYGLFEGRPLTTKGRWINPFVFGLFGCQKRIPAPKKIKTPVFIIGTGRSGTTILGIVLSMHRDVGFLNEPKALWHSAYEGEDLIGSYSLKYARYRLDESNAKLDVRRCMHRLFGWYLTAVGAHRIVDKYPELIFRIPFVKAIFPDAKFIFLVRNGFDTSLSIDHWSERLGVQTNHDTYNWWGRNNRKWNFLVDQIVANDPDLSLQFDEIKGFKRHIDMATVEWIVTMREGLRLREEFPESVHTLLYEDLVNIPAKILPDLLKFCELKKDDKFIEYGTGVLKPGKLKQPIEIAECLKPAFFKTMSALGYQ
jgi:hypothetical protein